MPGLQKQCAERMGFAIDEAQTEFLLRIFQWIILLIVYIWLLKVIWAYCIQPDTGIKLGWCATAGIVFFLRLVFLC